MSMTLNEITILCCILIGFVASVYVVWAILKRQK